MFNSCTRHHLTLNEEIPYAPPMPMTAYQRRYKRKGKPKGPDPDETSAAKAKRHARANALMELRCTGMSLYNIGQAQNPKISAPRVYQIITDFMAETAVEVVEKVREIHVAQCNVMMEKVWPAVLMGDIAAINSALAIQRRIAQLMGVDLQPMVGRGDATRFNADGTQAPDPVIHLVIEGDPEPQRLRWLEDQARLAPRRAGENLQ